MPDIILCFHRADVDPRLFSVERQAPNGNWSSRQSVNPQIDYELGRFGVPAEQYEDVRRQLNELAPGDSLTLIF
jgi:hypothetical protein